MDRARTDRLVLAAIGLAQGVVYWLAYRYWPAEGPAGAFAIAPVVFVAVAGTAAQFAWTGRDRRRLTGIAALTGAAFAIVAFWVWWQIPAMGAATYRGDQSRTSSWWPAALIALYALGPYVQIFQRTGRFRFPYADLFFHSWCNFFIGAMGQVFVGVFWALIRLWGALFGLLGIEFFAHVFNSSWFNALALPAVFGYGVARGRESARITESARSAALAVFRFLLPLLAVIGLLFLVSLPFTGLAPLWATRRAAWILLTMVALTLLFVNAVFEDGVGEPPYVPVVRFGVEATILALPIFAGLGLQALSLRIDQYGLTPERFKGLVVGAVLGVYALGYAVAVLVRRGPWLGALRPVNVALSFVVASVALLLHTPVLDPPAWSARAQLARLVSGRADAEKFDYAYLRFFLGRVGFETLARIEGLEADPRREIMRAGVRLARDLKGYDYRYGTQEVADVLRGEHLVLGAGLEAAPEDLVPRIAADLTRSERENCVRERTCCLFAVDLNADGTAEYCLLLRSLSRYQAPCWEHGEQGWRRLGRLRPWNEAEASEAVVSPPDLADRLGATGAQAVPSRYVDVQIGDARFRLQP